MSNFNDNLTFLFNRSGLTKTAFAQMLGVERTKVNRAILGSTKKASKEIQDSLALYFNINEQELHLSNKDFANIMEKNNNKIPLLSFTAVNRHKAKWNDFFERIKGRYKVYYGLTDDKCVIVSLLEFTKISPNGIEIRFYNPYREDGAISYYEYRGFAYPVNELIYIYAEQLNGNDYEILSIVLSLGRSPVIGILEGLIMGIGVKEGTSMIAANCLLCRRATRQADRVNVKVMADIGYGYVNHDKLDKIIQKKLAKIVDQNIRLTAR